MEFNNYNNINPRTEYMRIYRENNREKLRIYFSNYVDKNRAHINSLKKKYRIKKKLNQVPIGKD